MAEKYKYRSSILIGILLLVGLWTISLDNYLVFHGISEMFSIVVACGIFMLTWNSRQFTRNSYFLFIGIAYLFVGILDLIHMLAYKGMGVFPGNEANLSAQLWIAARYVESVSLLIAPFVIGRKLKTNFLFLSYITVTAVLLGSILYWHIFPVCFIDGVGLTVFKKLSEYIISIILLASGVILFNKRKEFDQNIMRLLIASVGITIASELAFTFYIDAYGYSNLVGHYLKIISFYLIYLAVIKIGLTKPYALFARDIKRSEEELLIKDEAIASSITAIGITDLDGKLVYVNNSLVKMWGYDSDNEILGRPLSEFWEGEGVFETIKILREKGARIGEDIGKRKDGSLFHVLFSASMIKDKTGSPVFMFGSFIDITSRIEAEETLAQSEERYRGIFDESIVSVYVFDEKKNFIDSNQAGLDLLGYSRDELLNMSIPDVDADPVVVLPAHKQLLSGEKLVNYEHKLKRKDGTIITVLNNSRPLTDTKGNVIGMQSTLTDITERKKAQEALRESEDRFRNIFNHAMVGLYRTTPDGRVLMANPTILKMLGYESFEELTKRNLEKEGFEPGYSRSDFKKRIEAEGQVMGFEAAWTRRDNTIVYIRESAWPIRDEFGNILYYEGIIEDITEQKQAQKALDESAARLQLATSATRIGHWDWNLRTNEVYFSPEWKRQIGYEDHEIPDRYDTWESRLHPEDKQSTVKALEGYIAGRQAEYGIEFRLRHKDGSYRWIYTRAEKQLDQAGKPCRLFGCHVDITERKKAEEELRRSEQDKTLVLDNTNEIVAYHDLDHNIQWVNKAYLKATKRTFSELKGKKCYHAWELDRLCANCPVTKAIETGESQEAELTPQNQKHWPSTQGCWMVRAAPVRNEAGNIIGAIEVSYDITERKQTEEKLHQYQQRLKALASELTIAEERERRRIAAELHDNVQQSLALARIQLATARNCTSADKLTAILNEISDSMRQALQNARSLVFDLSCPSMNEIGLAAAVSEWLSEQIQKRHGLKTEFIDECGRVQLDEDMRAILFRSVRELLTNVVKHAKASRVNVCLKQNGDYLEIIVRDDGVGFDYTAQSGIMGHFGLFSIQERMADLGGSLEIESKPGNGSKVILKAPLNVH